MQLSVVIVNYNVRHFLEQCLRSVHRAVQGLEAEVWVVDNNSVDGSVAMLREHFPWVKLLANTENLGFARANNLAIRQSSGEVVLLLNPDTVVQEDSFSRVLQFMNDTPDAGAVGVKMVDGQGNFLPESKRALPTPAVAFYKLFGLSRLFPRSRRFGRYHLSYLPQNQTNPVEVLSGACMFLRRQTLQQVGLLDEDYFMYGEDVDLSYRIARGGWKNYYFPHTQIIHYKGESTKKGSLNYVLVFYNAMLIFVRKHHSRGRPSALVGLIRLAIYFRAGLSLLRRLAARAAGPMTEAALFAATIWGLQHVWFTVHPKQVPAWFPLWGPVSYGIVYAGALWVAGMYRRPFNIRGVVWAVAAGFGLIALSSYLFPRLNVSRMVGVQSAVATLLLALLNRALANWRLGNGFGLDQRSAPRSLVVGEKAEARRVMRLLQERLPYRGQVLGIVTRNDQHSERQDWLGSVRQLPELVRLQQVDELVLCNADFDTSELIGLMVNLSDQRLQFKIVPPGCDYLVGPNTILGDADLQAGLLNLRRADVRLKKRLFDLGFSLPMLLLWPLSFWLYRRPLRAFRNLLRVLGGACHLVGYIDGSAEGLPPLKKGLLDVSHLNRMPAQHPQDVLRLNQLYALHYRPGLDFQIVTARLNALGDRAA